MGSAADRAIASDVLLVVIDPAPDAMRTFLARATLDRTHLVSVSEARISMSGSPLTITPEAPEDTEADDWSLIRLPLDGPPRALEPALRGLHLGIGPRSRPTAVVVDPMEGPPPAPALLRRFGAAGLCPGVDLAAFDWTPGPVIWVTTPTKVTALHHALGTPEDSRRLAELLLALDLLVPGSPSAAWVAEAAAWPTTASRDDWARALRADYLETCIAELEPVRAPRGG